MCCVKSHAFYLAQFNLLIFFKNKQKNIKRYCENRRTDEIRNDKLFFEQRVVSWINLNFFYYVKILHNKDWAAGTLPIWALS